MCDEMMPRNLVGEAAEAAATGMSEEELAAAREAAFIANLPEEKLELRWRYANRNIQLYERRLRSLANYGCGSALRAWMRSRLEWVYDNKLFEQPEGVIVISIDPEGDVQIDLAPTAEAPQLPAAELQQIPNATIWTAEAGQFTHEPAQLKSAIDTFTLDLLTTLAAKLPQEREVFATTDEHGLIPSTDAAGELTQKLQACFQRLWAQERK